MLVNVWCSKLCEWRQSSAVQTVSQSYRCESSEGSRVQSYWPCITLWPISMFSRILASESAVTPPTKVRGPKPTWRSTRPVASLAFAKRMTLRMWATSRSPRSATTA
jgi:hypothetical protein